MNAIDMLKVDHKAIRKIFTRFEKLDAKDHAGQHAVVAELMKALKDHAAIEEDHFYPAVADAKGEPAEKMDAASDEHDHMDKMADELAEMSPTAADYRQRFFKLRDELSAHMREEEREVFPAAKKALGTNELDHLGDVMHQEKRDLA